jgi:hypothetical protein
MILKDGELILAREHITETGNFTIPEKKHFQFPVLPKSCATLPRKILRYMTICSST